MYELRHLSSLHLCQLILPPGFSTRPFAILASALSRLTGLRSLVLSGRDPEEHENFCEGFRDEYYAEPGATQLAEQRAVQIAAQEAASDFARSVGALTGLIHLSLTGLQHALNENFCEVHLSGLKALCCLELRFNAPSTLPEGQCYSDVGDTSITMLTGMTQLTSLLLRRWGYSGSWADAPALRLADTIAALPRLQELDCTHLSDAAFTALARRVAAGELPQLCKVRVMSGICGQLRTIAGSDVFGR